MQNFFRLDSWRGRGLQEFNQQLIVKLFLMPYNPSMDTSIIGKHIARGRKAKGLSQVNLADLVNVTPQAVSKWERGESLPDIFMLAKLAGIFDIYDLGFFMGDDPCPETPMKGGAEMESCENFTCIQQFVEYWQSCSVKGLQKIARKYGVDVSEHDTKEMLVKKLTDGMNEYCKNNP